MTLQAHLETGCTTVCWAWSVTRKDGVVLGFTDHDLGLGFDGISFAPSSGFTARAIEQVTGLAVDNTEAIGVLNDAAIRDEDVRRGLFDGAEVRAWRVNWKDTAERVLKFRGTMGEVECRGQEFRAELRGLSEALNQPRGRVYQKPCSAVLGDGDCQFDTTAQGFSIELSVQEVVEGVRLAFAATGEDAHWFRHGRLTVLDGAAAGAVGVIKRDEEIGSTRHVEVWEQLTELAPGDLVRLEAGCDKRAATCRSKFDNFLNFRGFPDIPGEDWLMSYPVQSGQNNGGSLS